MSLPLHSYLILFAGVCALIVYWKKLPRLRDKIIWVTSFITIFTLILLDIFYPRTTTNITFFGENYTYTHFPSELMTFGIIGFIFIICLSIAGIISLKKPNTSNRKIALIIIIPIIIAIIFFVSDIFY